MAAMSTALTFFSRLGDKVTYILSGHTNQTPKVVVCTRKVPVGKQTTGGYTMTVSYGVDDSDGNMLPDKASFQVVHSWPQKAAATTERDAALAVFRDIIASDEFTSAVSTGVHVGDQ